MRRVKRRRDKYNPYILENNNVITFVDSKGCHQRLNIVDDIYKLFDRFELDDLKYMNEYDRHIEHINYSDEILYRHSINNIVSLEDLVLSKIIYDYILKEIDQLPLVQKRRIKMYYLEDMTLQQIAHIENCSPRAIKYCLDLGIKKIIKKLKF